MSRYGIISDIHGNLHALQAVMNQMVGLAIDELICLGDIVGYGPFPDACLDLVYKNCAVMVQGNHDEAVIDPACTRAFNGPAAQAIHWTRDNLGPLHLHELTRLKAAAYVGSLVQCVHSSPVPGPNDYVHDQRAAALAFTGVDRSICLLGHTHVPIVFEVPRGTFGTQLQASDVVAHRPVDAEPIELSAQSRFICNPGSVGQPRDGDPRASFAVLDLAQSTFTVHRRQYDVAAAQEATQRAGLPVILAERLAIGA